MGFKTTPERDGGSGSGDPASAADSLQECLQALREVQQVGRIGSWRYHIADSLIWWSDELYRIFGLDPRTGPLSPELLFSLVHPDDREAFAAQVRSREPHRSDYRVVLPDGSVRRIHEEVRVECDAQGKPLRMYGTAQDVTERRRAEEELAGQQAMLRQILDTSSVAIFLVDGAGRITHANRCMAEMFGRAAEELVGDEYVGLVHPAEREIGPEKMLALLASKISSVDLERRYQRADGTEFWGHLTGKRFHDARGAELGLIGVISDVTERRRAEEKLRSSEARFRSMIENASVGILVADVETGKYLYANPEICRILGYGEQEVLALTATDLAAPGEQAESAADFQAHLEGSRRSSERTLSRADGSGVRTSINSVAMEFDGRPCVVGFFTDITERRLLEEERLRAQKLESIGTLAGGIAHDFNNLLQGVFGFLSVARISLDDREKAAAMLEQAEKALHQSVALTAQLLTFSKGGKPVRTLIDPRPVIVDAARFALSGSRVTPAFSIGDDLGAIEADGGQLGQVVQNLVLNAEQAMPLGGTIEIEARRVPPDRAAELALPAGAGLVEIAVRDHGPGIPPAHLPRIFDPYFTTKEKGSGLGLATAYSIVRNHDGAIHVESEPGKGSSFTVYLPAAPDARVQPAAVEGHPVCSRCRVLVMDDEEIVLSVVGELLQALGHEAEFATDGEAATALYTAARDAGRPFDVVILDLTIRGGMGGEETARRLREIDPAVRTVVSSGYSDDGVIATYREHGFSRFLKKPYSIRELSGVLKELLS